MLKLKPDPTFVVVVKIPTPTGETAIKVEYKHMTRDAYRAFIDAEPEKNRNDEEAIMDIAVGWQDVDTPFTRQSVADLCQQYHGAAKAIVNAWILELTQARAGN